MRAALGGPSGKHMKINKPCPKCRDAGLGVVVLVPRGNHATGEKFLGCPFWPKCTYTEPVPEEVRMEERGAPRLPGF